MPWPTEDWPEGELPPGVDLEPLLDEVFDDEGPLAATFAVVVVHRGRVVTERYHGALEHFDRPPTPVTAETPLLSWSMAKSVLHAVGGPAGRRRPARPRRPGRGARVGRPGRPAPRHHAAPAARHARRARLRGGLRRRPGLGRDRRCSSATGQPDMAHFAADRPLAAAPGTRFNYSSGTSNIISGVVARTVGPGRGLRPLPARPALRADRHGRAPTPSSTRPAPGWPRPTSGPPPATTPASGCSTCATASGTASACSRRAGSTTAARWSRSTTPRTPAPTAPTGGACAATRSSTSTRSAPSGPRATRARRSPSARPSTWSSCAWARRPLEREDALVPWRAAMVQAFADAR